MALQFSKYSVIEGVKVAMIDKEDVKSEVQHWSSAIRSSVLGANPPLKVMEGFFHRIWRGMVKKSFPCLIDGLFVIRLTSVELRDAALEELRPSLLPY